MYEQAVAIQNIFIILQKQAADHDTESTPKTHYWIQIPCPTDTYFIDIEFSGAKRYVPFSSAGIIVSWALIFS